MSDTKHVNAYYIGVFGLSITPICIFIAYMLEPSYNPFLQTISKLGVTDHGQYVFIIGAVMGGLSLIVFHYYYFKKLAQNEKLID